MEFCYITGFKTLVGTRNEQFVKFSLFLYNRLKYVEQELAKRRGKSVDSGDKEEKDQVDELYVVPEHLKVGF